MGKELEKLIAEGDIDQVLTNLRERIGLLGDSKEEKKIKDEVLQLSCIYGDYIAEKRQGILSYEEQRLFLSRISKTLIELVGQVPEIIIDEFPDVGLPSAGLFFGRKTEKEEIIVLLQQPTAAAIAISGGPGIGKSSLCLSILHQIYALKFYRKILFVNCEGARNADAVVLEIAREMNIQPDSDIWSRFMIDFPSYRVLLALDNAETPLGHDRSNFEELLRRLDGKPNLSLIITVRGQEIPYGPAWDKHCILRPVDNVIAKEIFLATAGWHFQDDPSLRLLLDQLGGWPLAIVLLASQAVGEPDLLNLLSRWEERRSRLLKRGQGSKRINDLRASLSLSIEGPRMTNEGLALFRILCLLPGGIHKEDINLLLPGKGNEGARILVRIGLAQYDEQDRLVILPPIRQYGEEYHPIKKEELDNLIQEYGSISEVGQLAKAEEVGKAREFSFHDLINAEYAINYALSHSLRSGIKGALTLAQYKPVASFVNTRNILLRAKTLANKLKEVALEANCIRSLGEIALREQDNAVARSLFEQAIPLFDQIGSLLGKANCIRSLGEIALHEQDNAVARSLFEQAIPLFDQIGSLLGKANCIRSLGEIALHEQDNAVARSLFEQAIPLFDQTSSLLGKADCIRGLGEIALREQDNTVARSLFEQAIPLFDQTSSLLGKANCFHQLGEVNLKEKKTKEAIDQYLVALELYQRLKDRHSQGLILYSLIKASSSPVKETYIKRANTIWKDLGRDDLIVHQQSKGVLDWIRRFFID